MIHDPPRAQLNSHAIKVPRPTIIPPMRTSRVILCDPSSTLLAEKRPCSKRGGGGAQSDAPYNRRMRANYLKIIQHDFSECHGVESVYSG